ncbi:4-hydroxythreonine-4-phosphate dehydrogenase [Spirochaetota bacterium]|nr:4-hydroxythreonine-4-phosphate dehydrogenase [Spirochaetota bacterium]
MTLGDCAGIGPEIALKVLARLVCGRRGDAASYEEAALAERVYRLLETKKLSLAYLGSRVVLERTLKMMPACALGCRFVFLDGGCEDSTVVRVINERGSVKRELAICFYDESMVGAADFKFGCPSVMTGKHALALVQRGCELVMKGAADALVSCPLSKSVVAEATPGFVGHTEYLEQFFNNVSTEVLRSFIRNMMQSEQGMVRYEANDLDQVLARVLAFLSYLSFSAGNVDNAGNNGKEVAKSGEVSKTGWEREYGNAIKVSMGFVAPEFNVLLMTRHLPLRDVANFLTFETVVRTLRHASLLAYLTGGEFMDGELIGGGENGNSEAPSLPIGVLALNPHGGEGGLLGSEETVLCEALAYVRSHRDIRYASECGVKFEGPLAADTAFVKVGTKARYQNIVACYHDQGLIPLKTMAGMKAINVTLGLPFIRTSVDHGTAFSLAGKNEADETSLLYAIYGAWRLQRGYGGLLRAQIQSQSQSQSA